MLYLPRGTIHQAVAQEEGSTHLTLSTYQRWTWGDLASSMLRTALESKGQVGTGGGGGAEEGRGFGGGRRAGEHMSRMGCLEGPFTSAYATSRQSAACDTAFGVFTLSAMQGSSRLSPLPPVVQIEGMALPIELRRGMPRGFLFDCGLQVCVGGVRGRQLSSTSLAAGACVSGQQQLHCPTRNMSTTE